VPFRELFQIRNIERFTNVRIQRGRIPTADEVSEARENVFIEKLRALLTGGEYQKHDAVIERLLEGGFSSTDVCSALIHLLKTGEAAKPAPRTENYDRPPNDQRPGGFDRGQRDDRRPRFDDRRDDRRERPQRFEERPPRRDEPARPARTAPWKSEAPRPPKVVIPPPSYQPDPAKPAVEKPVTAPVTAKAEAVKTFSDGEILASVKSPEPKPESKLFLKPKAVTPPASKAKASRATPADQTRLWMSLGETQGVTPIDIVNAVAGETGLPGKVVGTVDVREKHLFVDVASEHANGIIAKLNRASIKGHKVKVKIA
jgi:ATP-dependent RNA helicase DeaD